MAKKVNDFYSKMQFKIIRIFELQDSNYLGLILEPQFRGSICFRYRVDKKDFNQKVGDIIELNVKTLLDVISYYQSPICYWRLSLENEKNLRCKLCGQTNFPNVFSYNLHVQNELQKQVMKGKLREDIAFDAFLRAYKNETALDFSTKGADIYT